MEWRHNQCKYFDKCNSDWSDSKKHQLNPYLQGLEFVINIIWRTQWLAFILQIFVTSALTCHHITSGMSGCTKAWKLISSSFQFSSLLFHRIARWTNWNALVRNLISATIVISAFQPHHTVSAMNAYTQEKNLISANIVISASVIHRISKSTNVHTQEKNLFSASIVKGSFPVNLIVNSMKWDIVMLLVKVSAQLNLISAIIVINAM